MDAERGEGQQSEGNPQNPAEQRNQLADEATQLAEQVDKLNDQLDDLRKQRTAGEQQLAEASAPQNETAQR